MEQEPERIVTGRAEEQSGSLLLTYFQGDINSMVDAHFSRALAKATKPKGDNTKNKKVRKQAKSDAPIMSHWDVQSPYESPLGHIELGRGQEAPTNNNQPLNTSGESSRIWIGGPGQGTNLLLPHMMYPSASALAGSVGTNNHYTSSLLSLLQPDRPDLSSVTVHSPKQEFVPGWARHPGFGDQMPPDHSLNSGVPMMEKKDLYWY